MHIESGESIEDFVLRTCGYSNQNLIDSVKQINAAQALAGQDARDILEYPCVYRRENAGVKIGSNLSVLGAAERLIGSDGPKTTASISALNPGISLSNVVAGTKITLPFESHPTTFLVRADLQKPPAEITAALQNIKGVQLAHATDAGHIIPASDADLTANDRNACARRSATWPVDGQAISAILSRYMKEQARHSAISPGPAIVAVVDTGISSADIAQLPFSKNPLEKEAPPVRDWDQNGYPNDVIGVNLIAQSGAPVVAAGYPYAAHGLEISSVASGVAFLPSTASISRFVSLKMLSIVENENSSNPSNPSWRVVPGDLATSISYLRSLSGNRPIVANWSWEASGSAPAVAQRIADGQELIAVAAGNRGAPIDDDIEAIPGRFSLTAGGYVLSVAALRPDGHLAEFSNYGSRVVTLAAPGCNIPAFQLGGGIGRADGTSVASPLVAMTAAIIKALNASASAESLYKRIVATADHLQALDGLVMEGRALNVPDAIAVYDDVLRLRDGTTVLARISDPMNALSDNGTALTIDDVLRYSFEGKTDGTTAVEMLMNRPKETLQTEHGLFRSKTISFTRVGGTAVEHLSVTDVSVVIPAMIRN